jgi:hypothetical protein
MLDSLDVPSFKDRRCAPSGLRPEIVNVIPKHPAHRLRDRSQISQQCARGRCQGSCGGVLRRWGIAGGEGGEDRRKGGLGGGGEDGGGVLDQLWVESNSHDRNRV